uniref:DUF5600 domain-containing protein n=1 Tax=Trichuris muris TaxID=70415 RepID=A0A5S6Q957_TRIMR
MKFWKGLRSSECSTSRKAVEPSSKFKLEQLPPPSLRTFHEALKVYYDVLILPIEKALNLHLIYPVPMEVNAYAAPSTILFLGLPSVGKTSLIQSLLCNCDVELDTDESHAEKFTIIRHGARECTAPVVTEIFDRDFPYPGLRSFGEQFCKNCDVRYVPSPLLEKINIIDTPGMLTMGCKRLCCGYDFEGVIKANFLEDNIRLAKFLQPYEHKMTVVLNKVDTVDWSGLDKMHVNLMLSISVTLKAVNVTQILQLSAVPDKCKQRAMKSMISRHRCTLQAHLIDVPFDAHVQLLHEVVRRARMARTFALICSALPRYVPTMKGKAGTMFQHFIMKKLIKRAYQQLIKKQSIKLLDLPEPSLIQTLLTGSNGKTRKDVTSSMILQIEDFLKMGAVTFVHYLLKDSQYNSKRRNDFYSKWTTKDFLKLEWVQELYAQQYY